MVTWFNIIGLLDEVGRRQFLDPAYGCAAVLTGVRGGYDLDYDRFAAVGVTLLGHLRDVERGTLVFADDLRDNMVLWDESRWKILERMIDAYIQRVGLEAPADEGPVPAASTAWRSRSPILELDLAARGITLLLSATGFSSDFGWLAAPILDAAGEPIQQRGVTASPGLYFLGLRRMYTIKSSFLFGVGDDAAYLAEQIAAST